MWTIYYGGGIVTEEDILAIAKLFSTPKFWGNRVIIWAPRHHHCRVASHEAKCNPLEELACCNPFILSCLSGQGRGETLELDNCHLV